MATLLLSLFAIPCSAFAMPPGQGIPDDQPFTRKARHQYPWCASIGPYLPNTVNAFDGYHYGCDVSIGYLLPTDAIDFRLSARSQFFNTSDCSENTTNTYFGLFSFDALFRFQQFYVGPGVGYGTMSGTLSGPSSFPVDSVSFGGPSGAVYSITAGYDISSQMFIESRFQRSPVDAYNGISLSLGVRFQI